jgi:uncharacterized damage-inducible protein DinB
MQTFFSDYWNNLHELHDEARTAVNGLPQEALDWSPGVEMNSIHVLVTHLTGSERYWIGDVVAGEASERDRDSEFRVHGASGDELLQRLSEVEGYIKTALGALTLEKLDEKRIVPTSGREVTVGWALGHALSHTAQHVGQMQITRQLWEQGKSGG